MTPQEVLELSIAAAPLKEHIPKGQPLKERLLFAMRYVRDDSHDLFWYSNARPTDDQRFRAALAAVLIDGDEDDRRAIEHSLKPLNALGAALSGVPVDWDEALRSIDDALPLLKLWAESAQEGERDE